MNAKNKHHDNQGKEIIGTIVFTILIILLMWGASKLI